ncbi:MAG: hypothetical protein CL920_19350 [Deltaproteobacteria bacterium]|nr:hypothetical protein [Deltaproteobacteria bacterium]MBU50844.1 hypothetical protein [Deltaproteobacteria bacterium]|tara:strand:- start:28 stop:1656 length:1629 start_codon:yes stop_codon:yes gene_type:complete
MPEQIGKYTLLKKIAVGGMAEIHLSEQSGPGGFKKQLVIKRILPHLVNDEKFLQMFQDEARVAAMMNHPNIVQIFDLGQEDSNFYIAMEYVSGFNLRSIIQQSNNHGMWLAPEYIAKIGSQIAEGLEYAHNFCDPNGNHLNLIHRDVSPQNIILSKQGIIKIVDFGIAKAKSNVQETQAGVIKGKLAYMSPEQVKGQTLDRRSDLFSLGIVMFELATHQRPFHGKTDIDMLRAILEIGPQPIDHLRPDFPHELNRIITRCLSKDRDNRYQSAREVQWDLENFLQSWGRPIGTYQLKELVNRVEQLENGENNASHHPPTPAPAPAPLPQPVHAPAPSNNFAEEETAWANDPRRLNQNNQNNHNNGWDNSHQNQWSNHHHDNAGSWDDDDDDEVTILNFPPSSNRPQRHHTPSPVAMPHGQLGARDLDTVYEPSAESPGSMTRLDEPVPQEIANSYMGKGANTPAPTVVNSPIPIARPAQPRSNPSTMPQPAPSWNPPATSPHVPAIQPNQTKKKNSSLMLGLSIAFVLAGGVAAALYFFVIKG